MAEFSKELPLQKDEEEYIKITFLLSTSSAINTVRCNMTLIRSSQGKQSNNESLHSGDSHGM